MTQKGHSNLVESIVSKCGTVCGDFTMVDFRVVTDLDLLKARLFNRSKLGENGCWVWQGSCDAHGYGMMSIGGKTHRAHRVSCEAYNGPLLPGEKALHSCDNPPCINPAHVRAGTQKENAADRESRGRRDVRGEQVGTSKLTVADVIAIRQSELSLLELASKFGVDRSNIWAIRAGKSWAHVNAALTEEGN